MRDFGRGHSEIVIAGGVRRACAQGRRSARPLLTYPPILSNLSSQTYYPTRLSNLVVAAGSHARPELMYTASLPALVSNSLKPYPNPDNFADRFGREKL